MPSDNIAPAHAVITATLTPLASVDIMLSDLAAALSYQGIVTRTALHVPSAPNPQLIMTLIHMLRRESGLKFVLNCNGKDQLTLAPPNGGPNGQPPVSIHDAWAIPLVAWMIDHPAYHIEHLRTLPANSVVAVVDRSHADYVRDLGLATPHVIFCPHAGPRILPNIRPMDQRPMDVMFVGNLPDVPSFDEWITQYGGNFGPKRDALACAFDAVLAGHDLYSAVRSGFSAVGLHPAAAAMAPIIKALDLYICQSRRLEILSAITDTPVDIFGEIGPRAAEQLKQHRVHGPASFSSVLGKMSQCKILLNSRKTFADAGHERIFYAVSRGAVVFSDPSAFLAEDQANGWGIASLPAAPCDINAALCHAVQHPAEMQTLQTNGLHHYEARHSWQARSRHLLDDLRQTIFAGHS